MNIKRSSWNSKEIKPTAILNRLPGIQRYIFNEGMSEHMKKRAQEKEQILEDAATVKP